MGASTAPACKAAILTILGTVADLADVDRRWAIPTETEDFAAKTIEVIYLGNVEITDDNWAALGNSRRRENYRLGITTWVEKWGDDPQIPEQRAWDLWSLVEAALTADIRSQPSTLRSAGVRQFDQITALQTTGPAAPKKWGTRIDARITFTADIV